LYFGVSHSIVYSLGLNYFSALRESKTISRNERALVVGSPTVRTSSDKSQPLVDATAEANEVASHFVGATLLEGRSATLDAVERNMADVEVFHFAGHAISQGHFAGLLLAPSESMEAISIDEPTILAAAHIKKTQLTRCQLAVFSACSTGPVRTDSLVDPDSLVRAFLVAGVPHVIASHWDVDSKSAAEFMREFYVHLMVGNGVGDSIRKAMDRVRGNPGTSHPYFWAAFGLYGRN
jgi:CHAT domain-containing protein